MVNAYYLGQLTAQPVKFQKMAANSAVKWLVIDKFTKEAMGEIEEALAPSKTSVLGEGGQVIRQEPDQTAALREILNQEKELKGGPITQAARTGEEAVGRAGSYVKDKGQGAWNALKGFSETTGKALGGEAGKGFTKNPHTRTIAALLALLGAGAGGAYALSGGSGDKKER